MPALLFPNFQSFFLWIRDLSHTAKISNIFVWFICLLIFLIFSIQTLGDLFLFVFVLQRNLSLFSSVAPGFSRAARPVPAPRLRKHPPRWPLTCVYLSVVHADLPPRHEKRLQHYLLADTVSSERRLLSHALGPAVRGRGPPAAPRPAQSPSPHCRLPGALPARLGVRPARLPRPPLSPQPVQSRSCAFMLPY